MPLHVLILDLICASCWAISYILIIRQARLDKRVGMPLVPLCINISYEFIFGFVYPDVAPACYANQLWFLLDIVLVAQYLRYGREEFTGLVSPRWFVPGFVLTLALGALGVLAVTAEFNDYNGGNYTGWGDQLLVSASFVFLLTRRQSSAGQSMYIGISRLIGSAALVPVQYALMPSSVLLPLFYAGFVTLDLIYLALLYRQCKVEGRNPWAFSARRLDGATADLGPTYGRASPAAG